MNLQGSQTEKNLLTAFSGESQARNRYTYYASKAKKEGYIQISAIDYNLPYFSIYLHCYWCTLFYLPSLFFICAETFE